jgi:polyisoprenoid-binding protein YceI
MKTIRYALSVLMMGLLIQAAPAVAADGKPGKKTVAKAATSLQVDPAKSSMVWTAKKVGGEHTGNVKIAKGVLSVDGKKLTGGSFDMDMTSMNNTDITNESFNAKLVNHLKSEDFFHVEKHPTSTFQITKAEPIAGAKAGEPNYTITGDLTIKGITHSISFPATVSVTGDKAEATAKIDLDRTKWDIKYRAAIIGTAADKIIDDNFTIDLKVVADKKSVASK